jgi:hypothetical protein
VAEHEVIHRQGAVAALVPLRWLEPPCLFDLLPSCLVGELHNLTNAERASRILKRIWPGHRDGREVIDHTFDVRSTHVTMQPSVAADRSNLRAPHVEDGIPPLCYAFLCMMSPTRRIIR